MSNFLLGMTGIIGLLAVGTEYAYKESSIPLNLIFEVLFCIGAVALFATAFFTIVKDRKIAKMIKSQFEETYGIKITDQEFEALQYPVRKPSEETRTYGSFAKNSTNNKGKVETSVYLLIWQNRLLQLKKA